MNKKRIITTSIIIGLLLLTITTREQQSLMQTRANLLQQSNTAQKSDMTQTRTDQWILDLQANYNNPTWFYGNLNATDRLMIRQAMDIAIPRTEIINTFVQGFGQPIETYELPQMGEFFNPNVTVKPYNLTQAHDLLTQVFGYNYTTIDDPSTPYQENLPYFPINLLVPTTGQAQRLSWAKMITKNFDSIGLGTQLLSESLSSIIGRVFPVGNSTLGWNYANGGFDGLFIAFGGGNIFPDDGAYWYGSNHIPYYNYGGVSNPVIDNLISQENNPLLTANQRLNYYYEMQNYVASQSLKYVLFLNTDPYVFSPNIQGLNKFFENFGGVFPYQNISFGLTNQINMSIGVFFPYRNLMPLLSNDRNSSYVVNNLWAGGLLGFSTSKNDSSQSLYHIYPNLAYRNYTVSSDGLFYNFTLRPHVAWADGSELTTQDVAFTYTQALDPSRNAVNYGLLSYYLNKSSIHVYDKYHIGFSLIKWAGSFPLGLGLFTQTIVPNSTYSQISDWQTNAVNTGNYLNASLYNSNGPYQIEYINQTSKEVKITVNPLYNSSTYLFPEIGGPVNETYAQYVSKVPGFNVTPSIQSIIIKIEPNQTTGLSDLIANKVNFLDTSGLKSIYSTIFNYIKSGTIKGFNVSSTLFQELGLNQNSEIWGYTPQGICYGCGFTITGTSFVTSTSIISDYLPTSSTTSKTTNIIETLINPGFIGEIVIVISVGTILIVVLYSYVQYRKNFLSKSKNNSSFYNFLKNLHKKRNGKKPDLKIDNSLETLEEIIEENKE